MEKQRTTTDEARARTMIAKACGMVGAALTSDAGEPNEWLKQTSAQFVELLEGRVAAQAWVSGQAPSEETERVRYHGSAGMPSNDAARKALAAAESDDFAIAVWSAPKPWAAQSRAQLMSDRMWQASGHRRARLDVGLYEFARASAPIELVDGPGVLTMQLDGLATGWKPDDLTLAALESVTPAMARGFFRRFIHPAKRRHQLLSRLSESQRTIAPLLVAGLTEREVALRLERSMHTVHEHTREIYRAFNVRSRMEMRDMWFGIDAPTASADSPVTIREGASKPRTGSAS